MTLPPYLWAAGANAVGNYHPADRVRCSECRRWERLPAFYELDRVLCGRHQAQRVTIVRQWLEEATTK